MKKSWSLSGNKEGFKLFIFHFSFDYLIDEWWGMQPIVQLCQLWVRKSTGATIGYTQGIYQGNHWASTGNPQGKRCLDLATVG